MKRIFAMFLACIMVLSLVACGNATNVSDTDSKTDSIEECVSSEIAKSDEQPSVLDSKKSLVYLETSVIEYGADGSAYKFQTYEYDENGYLLCEVYKDNVSNAATTYTYDDNGKVAVKEIANANSTVYRYEYEYTGELVSKEFMYADNLPIGRIEYEYKSDGNVTLETSYSANGAIFTTIYEYDDSDNLVNKAYGKQGESPSETTIWTYDSEGNKISENTETNTNGSRCTYYEWKYDTYGNIIEEIHREYVGKELEREYITSYTYEYSADGLIEKKEIATQGFYNYGETESDSYSCYIYEYNSDNLLCKESHMNSDGELESWIEYEYDSENNLTKETYYDGLSFFERLDRAHVSGNEHFK